MSGDSEEGAVISARVEVTRVEIPMIAGKNLKIGLYQSTPMPLILQQHGWHFRRARHVVFNRRELFGNTDDRIGVKALVRCTQPVPLGMPRRQPLGPAYIRPKAQVFIFEE